MNLREQATLLSEIGPAGVQFHHGISLSMLQSYNIMATEDDLTTLLPAEADAVLKEAWENGCYDLIEDRELAEEVFVFAVIFGENVAAWLLNEANTKQIGKDYEMHQPPVDMSISDVVLSRIGHVLPGFRLLTAGYIGWLRRSVSV